VQAGGYDGEACGEGEGGVGAAHKSEEGVVNLYDAMEIACCDTVFDGLDLQAD